MHTTTAKIYWKDPQTLAEVIRLVKKLNAAQQLTATLTPSMASMMSNNDSCFVYRHMGHFGYQCLDAQCYGCDEYGHFVQDCPKKIPPSGTPHHQDKSHSRHQYTHTQRDRSHSTYYGPRHGRHFSRSQFHHHYHHARSSSFRKHTSCSSSSHHSSLPCPSADGHPHCHSHSHCDISTPQSHPILHSPLFLQASLMPLFHGPEQVLLQQLSTLHKKHS